MNFQTTLPYAADSGLHVIEGLDVTGTPIYQRTGLDRFLPVDMYTLLQGVIERCLATQQPGGNYLVSPTIFDETMKSTTEGISYEPISKWIERTYPGGELSEVTGYVKNLMDMYPQNLILQAIDDKLWKLGNCSSGTYETQSVYGNLMDTPPYFQAFRDITFAMTQAGVGFSYVTFEMVLIPARASSTGLDQYGAPSGAVRIYPEMLIARYKVLQELRYKKASVYEPKRASGATNDEAPWPYTGAGIPYGVGTYVNPNPPYYWDYSSGPWPSQADREVALGLAESNFMSWYRTILSGVVPLMTQAAIDAFFLLTSALKVDNYTTSFYRFQLVGRYMGYPNREGPNFKTKAYGINHDVKMWGWWDGTGDPKMGWNRADGTPVVAGKNLMWDVSPFASEANYDADVDWNEASWPPSRPATWPPPYYWTPGCEIQLSPPIEDWKFNFCKHSDFGGDVTWHI